MPFLGCSSGDKEAKNLLPGSDESSSDNNSNDNTPSESNPAPVTDPPNIDTQINTFMTAEYWDVIYDGYGFVSFDAINGIILEPKAASSPGETHAALAISKLTQQSPLTNFKVTVKVTTEQQLRTPTPNGWECFWIFFNYTIGTNGKKITNYFTLKTNGIELGTAYDEVGQTFLVTESTPQLQIGVANEITLIKQGQQLQVTIDGKIILTYDGVTMPTPLIDTAGSIGLYTEDARVKIHSVNIEALQ